jgi:hypothetical protein
VGTGDELLLVAEDGFVEVRVGMAPVDESLTPIAEGKLTLGDGETLQVEGPDKPETVGEGPGVDQEGGLHHPDFAERPSMRNGISPEVSRHRCATCLDPRGGLGQALRREKKSSEEYELGSRNQSGTATAPRPAVRLARRKSRFIRVIVSMLISLGQASWHSP